MTLPGARSVHTTYPYSSGTGGHVFLSVEQIMICRVRVLCALYFFVWVPVHLHLAACDAVREMLH